MMYDRNVGRGVQQLLGIGLCGGVKSIVGRMVDELTYLSKYYLSRVCLRRGLFLVVVSEAHRM